MNDVYVVRNRVDLQPILAPLPDDMKLEVSPGLDIAAATVSEFRKLKSLPCALRLQMPRLRYPESTLKIEPAN